MGAILAAMTGTLSRCTENANIEPTRARGGLGRARRVSEPSTRQIERSLLLCEAESSSTKLRRGGEDRPSGHCGAAGRTSDAAGALPQVFTVHTTAHGVRCPAHHREYHAGVKVIRTDANV